MSQRDVTALQAVFFDMDGLLVDSERLWFEVEREVMVRLGAEWREEDQAALVGGSVQRTVRYMLDRSGADVDPEAVARWLLDDMADRLRSEVPLRPGAEKLLDEVIGARVPRALVSSAHRALIDPVLDALGPDRFDVTVAGDEVRRTKPDPEPYLKAAGLLGVHPGGCVVLEDSPNGLASAEAAGCVTVAVPSVVPIPPAPGRTVVRSLYDVDLALLETLVRRARA
ncbi:MAG: HAD-IA family hydrolase [Streptosporangiales bacterium]|nr:HAD-IA family hydrolase [Streptosporangiales bacterium]